MGMYTCVGGRQWSALLWLRVDKISTTLGACVDSLGFGDGGGGERMEDDGMY